MRFTNRHHRNAPATLTVIVLSVLALVLAACSSSSEPVASSVDQSLPEWVESVYPSPGADIAVPDAVEVDYEIQGTDQDVRLQIDGVDVTVYANVGAGELRYESGSGPVDLGAREHTASVDLVQIEAGGTEEIVVDSFDWQFRTR